MALVAEKSSASPDLIVLTSAVHQASIGGKPSRLQRRTAAVVKLPTLQGSQLAVND